MRARTVRQITSAAVLGGALLAGLVLLPRPGPERARVLYVVDGDTLKVEYQGARESVRLIGIDAPEVHANAKARRDARRSRRDLRLITRLGRASKQFVESRLARGAEIRLEFDVEKRDRYGRLLAYVVLADGTLFNAEIVRAGYAGLMTIPPNVKYRAALAAAFESARESRAGLWQEDAFP